MKHPSTGQPKVRSDGSVGSGAARPLTVLVTGFGPFPGAHFNPTPEMVRRLVRSRHPALHGVRLTAHVFVTSYTDVDAALPALLAKHRPDIVLMFGLAARTPFLRIETTARQARSRLKPDAAGVLPDIRNARRDGITALRGRAPLRRLLSVARAVGTDARLSHNAGWYLCNELYWRVLEQDHGGPGTAVFVHVPQIVRNARPTARCPRRRIEMADLLRAGEAILRVLVARARAKGHAQASRNGTAARHAA